jgi:hypothetical protein
MISRSPLLGTFLYALLTPRIILRQILQFQSDGKPVSNDDLNYAFAVAHQLGAQYAALAFVTGKLNLDVTLETPSQPALLLWNTSPSTSSHTQHYMNLPQVQTLFLSNVRYHVHESAPQNVVSAILEWQEAGRKEIAVTIEAFCVKCKQKRVMLNPQKIVTKNGRNAMEGRCPVCDTRLFRFVSGQVIS